MNNVKTKQNYSTMKKSREDEKLNNNFNRVTGNFERKVKINPKTTRNKIKILVKFKADGSKYSVPTWIYVFENEKDNYSHRQ